MRIFLALLLLLAVAAAPAAAQRKAHNLPGRAPTIPYSDAIQAGDTLYLAGKLGSDPKTNQFPSDFSEEVRQCMKNLGEVLKLAGYDFPDVVKTTVFLTDMTKFEDMNKVYREFFKGDPPARSTVGVAALVRGGRIEVEMIAVKRK